MPNITCPSERVFAAGTTFLLLTAASEFAMMLFLISGSRLSIASEVQPWSSLGRLNSSGSVNLRLRRASPGVMSHSFKFDSLFVCEIKVSVRMRHDFSSVPHLHEIPHALDVLEVEFIRSVFEGIIHEINDSNVQVAIVYKVLLGI